MVIRSKVKVTAHQALVQGLEVKMSYLARALTGSCREGGPHIMLASGPDMLSELCEAHYFDCVKRPASNVCVTC